MADEISSQREHRPAFPRWLLLTVVFYSLIAAAMIDDSLRVHITRLSDGRVIADDWTLTFLLAFAANAMDPKDAGSIASSIAENFLSFIFGCLIGLTAIGLLARKRSANAVTHLLNMFQFMVGLAFVIYYAVERDIVFLVTGGPFLILAIIQYRIQSRADVRRWLRSYTVEFFSIRCSDPTTRSALRSASLRKAFYNIIFGLQVLIWTATTASLISETVTVSIGTGDPLIDALNRWFFVPMVILFLLVLPVVIIYAALTVAALFWRRPPRVLLLRPFHAPEISLTLKNIVRDSVGYLAQVYTLSDSGIHQRWYMKWPIVIPQMWLVRFHESVVTSMRSLDRLQRKLRRTFFRNINWFASSGRLFSISATDDRWQSCVSRLLSLVDVVLFDISNPTQNIDWELRQIVTRGASANTIFITRKSTWAQAATLLQSNGLAAKPGDNVFLYDDDGFSDVNEIMKRLVVSLTAGHARGDASLPCDDRRHTG